MIGLNPTRVDVDWPVEATHIRLWDIGVAWCEIHAGPHAYDWRRLDDLVDRCGDRHVTYVIAGTPRWLARDPDSPHAAPWLGPGRNSVPHSLQPWDEFLTALATRYAGRIDAYEVWNEPQLADFLYPYDNASCNALATMTRHAFDIVAKRDPKAIVVGASILPRASSGGLTRARRWLNALERQGWPVHAFSAHIYPAGQQTATKWRFMLNATANLIASYRPPVRRLWVTETTFGLLGPAIADDAARRLVTGALDAAGDRVVHWYGWGREDLGGMRLGPGSAAWAAIVDHHEKGERRERTA